MKALNDVEVLCPGDELLNDLRCLRWTTRVQFRRAAASNSHATSATVESTRSSRETRRLAVALCTPNHAWRSSKMDRKGDSGGRAFEMLTRVRLRAPVLWRQCARVRAQCGQLGLGGVRVRHRLGAPRAVP